VPNGVHYLVFGDFNLPTETLGIFFGYSISDEFFLEGFSRLSNSPV